MKDRVVITGVGVVSALGNDSSALRSGESAARALTTLNDRELPSPGMGAPIDDFEPADYLGQRNLRPLDRAGRFAASAACLALESAGWTPELRESNELDLVIGTMFCSAHTIAQFDRITQSSGPKFAKPLDFANTVINAAGGQTAIWQNLRGANTTVAAGKVSALRALKLAQFQIAQGHSAAALVGGVEELCFETHTAFQQAGHEFILGEGAGFLVLEREEAARDRGARIRGQLLGCGSSYDISRGEDEENAVARVAASIQAALAAAEMEPEEVNCISCSANDASREDRYERKALERVFDDSVPRLTIGQTLGETLGASGMMQSIAFLESDFEIGLIVSLGFDGSSAAAVIRSET